MCNFREKKDHARRQLENSSQKAAEGQIKVDEIQAEPVAAAEHTSLQNTISDQTGPIQTNLGTK